MANDVAVRITADASQFQREVAKVTSAASKAAGGIKSAFSGVQGALGALGVGFSAAAFVGLIKGSIDAADRLRDLSQRTGVAVETLGGIGFAAKQAGTDLDGVAKAFGKFNLKIAEATGGNEQAAKAFAKIGISIGQLNSSRPEEIFTRLADAFEKYADGPRKAALGNEFFKKGYQEILPLLNEGGEAIRANIVYFQKYSGITSDLADKADKFNDTVEKMKLLNGAFANTLAAKLLPSLQGLVDLYVEAKEKGDGFSATSERIADGLKVIAKMATVAVLGFVNIGDALGALAAKAEALSRLDFKAFNNIGQEREETLKRLQKEAQDIFDAIDGKRGGSAGLPRPKQRPQAPSLGSTDRDDTAKRMLEGVLKGLENAVKEEQDLLKDREHFLQRYYADGQIGIREYFERRQDVIDAGLAKELAAYDQGIAALQSFASTAGPKERVEAETKIADIIAKRAKAEKDAAVKGIDLWLDQKKAAEEFASEIEDVALQMAQLSGNTVAADLFGFDKATAKFKAQAQLQAASRDESERRVGQAALAQLDNLRALTAQQSQLNKVQRDFGNIMEELGQRQGRVDLDRAAGNLTEIDALNKKAELAKSYIGILEQQAAASEALAAGLPEGSARTEAILNAGRLRQEIDRLKVSAMELEIVFRDIFTGAVADGLADIVTGTKSVKEAFKDMEKQIVASISRIASQNIAESIFGKSGVGGGIGSFIASLFGGTAGTPAGFAAGGSPPVGRMSLVGEKGPELFIPKQPGVIIPNDVLNAKRSQRQGNISININVPGNVSKSTADQIALQTGVAVQRALARNG
jgi:hypothetical protein